MAKTKTKTETKPVENKKPLYRKHQRGNRPNLERFFETTQQRLHPMVFARASRRLLGLAGRNFGGTNSK